MASVDATTQKVQRILTSEFDSVRLTKDGGFAIEHGSTITFIEVLEWAPDADGNPRSLVRVWAPLGRDVRRSPEMYRWAATEGQAKLFGGVSILENPDGDGAFLMFATTLLGDYIDPAELTTAVFAVVFTADDLDDLVRERFGGKRYTDAD